MPVASQLGIGCYVRIPRIRSSQLRERYHSALLYELGLFETKNEQKPCVQAVFLGGDGAASLSKQGYLDIAGILKRKFSCACAHVTVEVVGSSANFLDATLREPLFLSDEIGRVAYNPKSLWRTTGIKRAHELARVERFVTRCAQAGKTVALDLEVGHWPEHAWKELIEIISGWPVQHLSLYFAQSLQVEDDHLSDLFLWSAAMLAGKGFVWQGTYDFARGEPSAWTSLYAERRSYRGFGAGAWSYESGVYWANVCSVTDYCARLAHERSLVTRRKLESPYEIVAKGLSRKGGISLNELGQILGEQQNLDETLEKLVSSQYLSRQGDSVSFTSAGFLLENGIVIQLVKDL